ncbi:MAG: nicotinate-nucleotide adenylyltransferase [Acidobacteriaceae bacterium]|jgi:nicotinate-nucleotide adenylyltransferase|nr:nicotinate-nucleotide adenylyltransferase [Acidobacteriaceae bacterium]
MRIALFGGSFDPPHSGHIGIAMAAVERLHLDRVLMAPVGRQPLKRDQAQSPYEDRMAMVQLACAGHPPLVASAIDAPQPDGRYNYTYDTLQRLRETLSAGDKLFCLVGADSLQTLHHWHRAAEALILAEWIVAARPGFIPEASEEALEEALETLLPAGVHSSQPERGEGWLRLRLTGPSMAPSESGNSRQGRLWLLPDLHYDVSATDLRAALADESAGIPQRVLDPRVAEYAREHGLYDRT